MTAGHCISAIDDAREVTRVIPAAALTGEVAEIAAALSVEQSITPDKIVIKQLQKRLKANGLALHQKDIKQ